MSPRESLCRLGGWLQARLTDPGHSTRNIVIAIATYAVVWAFYATISNSLQNLNTDMTEQAVLGRTLAFGYAKHPPMSVWVPGVWFALFPETDWAYYLLSFTIVGIGLFAAWRIARRYLAPLPAALALVLLTFIPFYNFHAIRFNANSLQIALWPIATLFFLRSLEDERWWDALAAGLFAALAVLTKYWAVFLLAGFFGCACIHPNRARYFKSAAPWISIAVGAVVLAPHLAWLAQHDHVTLQYAAARSASPRNRLEVAGFYLSSAAAYVALAVVVALWVMRADRQLIREMLFPKSRQAQALLALLAIPVLAPVLLALAIGANMDGLWTMPAFALLPVVLLYAARPALHDKATTIVFGCAAVAPFVIVLLSPLAAAAEGWTRSAEVDHRAAAHALASAWASEGVPMRIVAGREDLAYGAAYHLRDRPTVFPSFLHQLAPHLTQEHIRRDGLAIICANADAYCLAVANERANASSGSRVLQLALPAGDIVRAAPASPHTITIIPPDKDAAPASAAPPVSSRP